MAKPSPKRRPSHRCQIQNESRQSLFPCESSPMFLPRKTCMPLSLFGEAEEEPYLAGARAVSKAELRSQHPPWNGAEWREPGEVGKGSPEHTAATLARLGSGHTDSVPSQRYCKCEIGEGPFSNFTKGSSRSSFPFIPPWVKLDVFQIMNHIILYLGSDRTTSS